LKEIGLRNFYAKNIFAQRAMMKCKKNECKRKAMMKCKNQCNAVLYE
jgi:hypothetical protein